MAFFKRFLFLRLSYSIFMFIVKSFIKIYNIFCQIHYEFGCCYTAAVGLWPSISSSLHSTVLHHGFQDINATRFLFFWQNFFFNFSTYRALGLLQINQETAL